MLPWHLAVRDQGNDTEDQVAANGNVRRDPQRCRLRSATDTAGRLRLTVCYCEQHLLPSKHVTTKAFPFKKNHSTGSLLPERKSIFKNVNRIKIN